MMYASNNVGGSNVARKRIESEVIFSRGSFDGFFSLVRCGKRLPFSNGLRLCPTFVEQRSDQDQGQLYYSIYARPLAGQQSFIAVKFICIT